MSASQESECAASDLINGSGKGECLAADLSSGSDKSAASTNAQKGECAEEPIQKKGDKLANYLAMFGHLCSDINQGALNAILPFLIVAHDFSYTAVAMLVFAANAGSAVIQPLFGWLGDKKSCPWLMALGVFLAGFGMCGIGFSNDYATIVVFALVSGIGVAMFHPEGGRIANLAATSTKAKGMSIFAVGGNIGFFVGPALTAIFLTAFGMHGTLVFLFPTTICAIVLLGFNKRFKALGTANKKAQAQSSEEPESWGKFWLVMAVLSLRSIISYGIMAFVPLFMMDVLGQTETVSSLTLSIYSIAGAFATIASGSVSERVGIHHLMIVCLGASTLLIAMFAFNTSFPVAVVIAVALSVLSSLMHPSTVALGMSYVPRHLGMASGFSYGVTVAAGGMAEPFLGMAGDAIGLVPVMLALAAVSAAAVALGFVVKRADSAARK
jgi:MFS transporter, FSR family, fosmidomycin resistance protein